MNAKQVESLAETISALSSEDYSLLQSMLITKTIRKTAGVCGGHARVRNTRIAVWTLVSLAKQEMGEDELLKDFPGLTHFDLLAAQAYYRANKAEIDALIDSHHSDEDWDFRLYNNENLAAELVEALPGLGYDVLTSYEAGNANQAIPDAQVLAAATADQRCVVTFNRDDFAALHRDGINHEGIVVCKDDPERKELAYVLHDYLTHQKTLRNRLIRVLKKNQPGTARPVFSVREYSR